MNVQALDRADDDIQRILDRLMDKHSGRLEQVLLRSVGGLRPLLANTGTLAFADAVGAISINQLGALLEQAGYSDFQRQLFADYRELAEEVVTRKYPHLPATLQQLGGPSLRAIEAAMETDAIEWQRLGSDLAIRIKQQLEQMTLAPYTVSQAAQLLSTQTGLTLSRARTHINTSLAGLQRRIHMETAQQMERSGEDVVFYYAGPRDKRNRPFCARWAGRAITKQRLGQLDNGHNISVKHHAGGYNCRHDLLPMPRSFAEQEGIAIVDT